MSASVKVIDDFRDAERTNSILTLGIAGPAGSGKTLSALRVATGLTGGEGVFLIDTENGRALQYAYKGEGEPPLGKFRFKHGLLEPPFTPLRYMAKIDLAVKKGARCIIVDSASHEHEGEGGLLDMHEAALQKMAGSDFAKRERVKFTAWIEPKAQHGALVRYIQRMPVHLILCFRAKDKLEIKKNEKGKMEPTRVGWTPICADKLDYEMTATLILPPRGMGRPSLAEEATKFDDLSFGFVKDADQLTEETGRAFAAWCRGEDPARVKAPPPRLVQKDPQDEDRGPPPPLEEAAPPAEKGPPPAGNPPPVEEAPSIHNDLPTKNRVLLGARTMLAVLRKIETREAYNRFMEEGEAKLAWLEANEGPTWTVLEEARTAAFERIAAQA